MMTNTERTTANAVNPIVAAAGTGSMLRRADLPVIVWYDLRFMIRFCREKNRTVGVSSRIARAAPRGRLPIPVNSRYARTDSTSKSPPMMIGFPKSVIDVTNTMSHEARIPGIASGSVTVKNACVRRAPRLRAQVSRSGSIPCRIPESVM